MLSSSSLLLLLLQSNNINLTAEKQRVEQEITHWLQEFSTHSRCTSCGVTIKSKLLEFLLEFCSFCCRRPFSLGILFWFLWRRISSKWWHTRIRCFSAVLVSLAWVIEFECRTRMIKWETHSFTHSTSSSVFLLFAFVFLQCTWVTFSIYTLYIK